MLKKFLAIAFAVAVCMVSSQNAHALLITSNGDFDLVSTQDGTAPISDIEIISGSGSFGRIYTNQTDGTPFAEGSDIRTLSAYAVAQATDGIQHSNVTFSDGDLLVIVSAIDGTIAVADASGLVTATFELGTAFAIKIDPLVFDSRNPDTWDDGTIVATYTLLPPQDVVSGAPLGADVNFLAEQTNQSSVNSAASQQTQGIFLFVEDPPSDLLSNVDTAVVPPGLVPGREALVADIDQTLLFTDLEAWDFALDGADLAVLNAFAALAGFTDLGGAGTGFATGLGGAATTDFNPQWPPPAGDGPTGDFFATLGADNYVAIEAIPEPTSLVLLTIGAGGLGLFGRNRRKAKK